MVLIIGAGALVVFNWFLPRTPDNAPAAPSQMKVNEVLPAGQGAAAELRSFVAELDRKDPGWRLAEWEARRKTPTPNGATVVLAAAAHLPEFWPPEHLRDIGDPGLPVDRATITRIRAEMQQHAATLPEARKLLRCPDGRFSYQFSPNPYDTPAKHLQDVRKVARLLLFDVILRLDDHDMSGALESTTALLNAARSMGDEPTAIAQLVRLAGDQIATNAAARMLGNPRTAPATGLAAYQQMLEAEIGYPLLRTVFRADRAILHDVHTKLETGALRASDIRHVQLTPDETARMQELVVPSHLNFLQTCTQLMEMAEQPPHTWEARHAEIQARRPPTYLRSLEVSVPPFIRSSLRGQAHLRCTLVAVAVARFALVNGRPPGALSELSPQFVRALPANPYNGNALEYRTIGNGSAMVTAQSALNPSDSYSVHIAAQKP